MTRPSVLTAIVVLAFASKAEAATCDSVRRQLKLPNGVVTVAEEQTSGSLTPAGTQSPLTNLPAFCRVAVTLKPSKRSDIRSEVWLPTNTWNGKLLVTGNGSFAGAVNYASMAGWIREGYAVASTDTGHRGTCTNTFVNDDVLTDYSHRANHETTAAAKRLINAYYGAPPKFSFFQGCSTGGRSGLVAARMYPNDYDGISSLRAKHRYVSAGVRPNVDVSGALLSTHFPATATNPTQRGACCLRHTRWCQRWRSRKPTGMQVRSGCFGVPCNGGYGDLPHALASRRGSEGIRGTHQCA